jgi:hypothetical protein
MSESAVQYIGRSFDLLALRGVSESGEVLLDQSLFDEHSSGEICTGIVKLAQMWAIEFMTDLGSMMFELERGTLFMQMVRSNRLRSETDVRSEFNFAAVLVRKTLIARETAEMHLEDRFASAELLQITLSPGLLSLNVQIMSRAGDAREVILPISTLPIQVEI